MKYRFLFVILNLLLVIQTVGQTPVSFVSALVSNPEGTVVVAGYTDGKLTRLDFPFTSEVVLQAADLNRDEVRALAWQGNQLAVAYHRVQIEIWNTTQWQKTTTLPQTFPNVVFMDWISPTQLLLSPIERPIVLWDLVSHQIIQSYPVGEHTGADVHPFEPIFVASHPGDSSEFAIWSMITGEKLYHIPAQGFSRLVKWSNDGKRLLLLEAPPFDDSNSNISRLSIWNHETKILESIMQTPSDKSTIGLDIKWSQDGSLVYTVGLEAQVSFWSSATGKYIGTIQEIDFVGDALLLPNNQTVIYGGVQRDGSNAELLVVPVPWSDFCLICFDSDD